MELSYAAVKGKGGSGMRFSLRAKMMVVFGAVSLMVGLIGGLAFTYLTKMERSYNELLRVNAAIVQSASGIGETAQQQSAMLYSYLLAPGQDKEEKLAGINKQLTASAQALKSMAVREQDQNAAAKIAEANETFQRLLDKVADYIRRGEPDLARKEAELWSAPLTESMGTMADELAAGQKALMEEQMAQNAQRVSDIKLFVITASLAALLIALSLGLLLSRMIARPIREAAAAAAAIASGDLTTGDLPARSGDEVSVLAEAFNRMKLQLREVVGQAVRHADHVAEAALQLSGASVQGSSSAQHITDEVREIMERSEEQVLSVNRGAELLNDLTQTVCEVMEVSHHAREASAAALTDSEAGRETIARVTGQMNAMHATMGRLTDAVTRLSDRTEQIEKANQLIAGIANQTNILALNAGIEAVQAGAGGKGFSVIAGEVRKLAGQTSAAAAEIAHIAAGVKEEALGMAQATRRGAAETAEGLDAARHAGEAFGRIRESVTEAAGRIRHAVDCSERAGSRTREAAEQIRSIEQAAAGVTEGARKVAAGAEEQYAGMEEISASAEMLSRMADELRSLIQRFRT